MKSWSILLHKLLITFSNLCFLITIAIYPLFNFASQFKYNVAALITLLSNQEPKASNSFFNSLLENHGYVNYFLLGIILLLQITYLIPLWFFKKPFSVAMLNFYQLMINVLFIIILGFFFNWFGFIYFNAISISDLFIIPFVLIGINFAITFNFAVLYFAKTSQPSEHQKLVKDNPVAQEEIIIETPDAETLDHEQLKNKINDLKSILNK